MTDLSPRHCPFCGETDIVLAIASVVADSYLCNRCQVFFAVTYSPRTVEWTSALTNSAPPDWVAYVGYPTTQEVTP